MTAPAPGAGTAEQEEFRDALSAALAELGHELTWTEGHGIGHLAGYPGHTGTCSRCGGVVRAVLPAPAADYVTYEGPIEGPRTGGPLTCEAARNHGGTPVTQTRTTVNPNAPAQPWLTTWVIVKDPVDFGDLSKFTLSLSGAVMCARPSGAPAGAPDGHASMSFTTTDKTGERPRHQAFVLAAGKWLNDRKTPYAWRTGDGSWHAAGRR